SQLASATVRVTGGQFAGDGDVLAADGVSNGDIVLPGSITISVSYDSASETLVLSGLADLADYQSILDQVTFASTGGNPTNFGSNPTRTVTWTVADESNLPSATQTTTVSIAAVNDPPTLTGPAASVTFTQNGAAVTLAGAASVSDSDSLTLASATVKITGGAF